MTNRRSAASEAARQLLDAGAEPSQERRTEGAEPSPRRHDAGKLTARTCYFTPEEWAAVLEAAERTERSAAGFVRYAVRRALEG